MSKVHFLLMAVPFTFQALSLMEALTNFIFTIITIIFVFSVECTFYLCKND